MNYKILSTFIKDISFENKGRDFKQTYRDKSKSNFNKELNTFIKKLI